MDKKEPKITKGEFTKIVNEVLNEILGYETKEALIFHICLRKGFSKEEISDNIDKILQCLEELFGWASEVIFNEIILKLKLDYNIQIDNKKDLFNLAKEIAKLK